MRREGVKGNLSLDVEIGNLIPSIIFIDEQLPTIVNTPLLRGKGDRFSFAHKSFVVESKFKN